MNTFMKLWKVFMEENESGGWEGKEKGLLLLNSVHNSEEAHLQGSLGKENQSLKLYNEGFSWRERR